MKKKVTLLVFASLFSLLSFSQTNDSPKELYKWKNQKKTTYQPGYVVLKSEKKLDGQIALIGSYSAVTEVQFLGDGKEISFPISALKSYGLNASPSELAQTAAARGPISETSEGLYEWRDGGVVMNKKIYNSVPRDGYVVLKSGKKYEGQLRVQKRDEDLWNFQVKTSDGKEKFKAEEVAKYGLNVTGDEITQANLSNMDLSYFPGTVTSGSTMKSGEIAIVKTSFYSEKILLKSSDGKYEEYTPENVSDFTQTRDGIEKKYASLDGVFIEDEFNGNTFRLYRNPNPTTINNFATGFVKAGVQAGTAAIAEGIVNSDAKKNEYTTNLDSIIQVSTKEELIAMQNKLVQIGGYSTADDLIENSGNESLVNNVNALKIAIAGREFAESDEGIYNKEWVILNKKSGEKTIVYKSDYNELIEGLLFGCYDFLSLDKSAQREHKKWNNLEQTVSYLDKCY
ncbi:MAG: hypothetical protein ABJP45_17505 [Cyclobacteriaceae bacterium]